jgi:hypothetical protein
VLRHAGMRTSRLVREPLRPGSGAGRLASPRGRLADLIMRRTARCRPVRRQHRVRRDRAIRAALPHHCRGATPDRPDGCRPKLPGRQQRPAPAGRQRVIPPGAATGGSGWTARAVSVVGLLAARRPPATAGLASAGRPGAADGDSSPAPYHRLRSPWGKVPPLPRDRDGPSSLALVRGPSPGGPTGERAAVGHRRGRPSSR